MFNFSVPGIARFFSAGRRFMASTGSNLWSRAAVIAAAMIFGLTYSLSAALLAQDLSERGHSDAFIGANAAMHAVGVLAMAFALPRMVGGIGARKLVLVALVVAAMVLVLVSGSAGHLALVSTSYCSWRCVRDVVRHVGNMAQ
jgi:Na+/melibiose symporter-like transporter